MSGTSDFEIKVQRPGAGGIVLTLVARFALPAELAERAGAEAQRAIGGTRQRVAEVLRGPAAKFGRLAARWDELRGQPDALRAQLEQARAALAAAIDAGQDEAPSVQRIGALTGELVQVEALAEACRQTWEQAVCAGAGEVRAALDEAIVAGVRELPEALPAIELTPASERAAVEVLRRQCLRISIGILRDKLQNAPDGDLAAFGQRVASGAEAC
jgi:hypothetical protein